MLYKIMFIPFSDSQICSRLLVSLEDSSEVIRNVLKVIDVLKIVRRSFHCSECY